jgi:hypothetical protein
MVRASRRRIFSGKATFWAAVICGKSASFWKTMPIERLCGGTALTAQPLMKISPLVGSRKPAINRSKVVFPEPDGPRIVRNFPCARSKEASRTACTPS